MNKTDEKDIKNSDKKETSAETTVNKTKNSKNKAAKKYDRYQVSFKNDESIQLRNHFWAKGYDSVSEFVNYILKADIVYDIIPTKLRIQALVDVYEDRKDRERKILEEEKNGTDIDYNLRYE